MQILETEKIWDRLRDRYYQEFLEGDEAMWSRIKLKLGMVNELREVMRKIDNAR